MLWYFFFQARQDTHGNKVSQKIGRKDKKVVVIHGSMYSAETSTKGVGLVSATTLVIYLMFSCQSAERTREKNHSCPPGGIFFIQDASKYQTPFQ